MSPRAPVALIAAFVMPGCQELPRTYDTTPDEGLVVFEEDFASGVVGPAWRSTGEGYRVDNGVLTVENAKNHPLWLTVPLPRDYRVVLDAWADTEEGDIKLELNGDGRSFARSANYRPSGYVLVYGGWNNRFHVIARKDEHGKDRAQVAGPAVEPGRRYHFEITRVDGEMTWEVDGVELLRFEDPRPLHGPGQDRFAFNGWEARVHFDNLVIESLEPAQREQAAPTPTGGGGGGG